MSNILRPEKAGKKLIIRMLDHTELFCYPLLQSLGKSYSSVTKEQQELAYTIFDCNCEKTIIIPAMIKLDLCCQLIVSATSARIMFSLWWQL